jgi:hypothetical protein
MNSKVSLMDENEFWELIQLSKTKSESIQEQYSELKDILKKKTNEKIIGFSYHFQRLYTISYSGDLWAAPYIAIGFCSDDSFAYFRFWLISRGKEVFYNALDNPDTLLEEFVLLDDIWTIIAEFFGSVYSDAYREKNSQELDIILDSYDDDLKGYPEIHFRWQEDDEESMKKICPNIYRYFRKSK